MILNAISCMSQSGPFCQVVVPLIILFASDIDDR